MHVKPRADTVTVARVRACLDRCAESGKDPVQELDALGLLHHPGLVKQIFADTLFEAAGLLEQLTVKQLAGNDRMPTSPLDAKNMVVGWLRQTATKATQEGRRS